MEINKQKIFVDSNFFIAINRSNDTNFDKSIEISKKLSFGGFKLVISNLIFMEAVTVLSQRIDRNVAIEWGTRLINESQIEIIHINNYLQNRSWQIFQEVDRKNISFVDCSSIAVMKEYDIKHILTFDTTDFGFLGKKYRFKVF